MREGRVFEAHVVELMIALQLLFMAVFVRDPRKWAPLYNATGTSCYVAGMMVSACAMRALALTGH
jgi:chlorophyll synthase